MYTHPHLRHPALVYRALGNERRLYLMEILRLRKRTGTEITRELKIFPSAVSRHIQLLVRSGLITGLRIGKEVEFSISNNVDVEKLVELQHLFTKR